MRDLNSRILARDQRFIDFPAKRRAREIPNNDAIESLLVAGKKGIEHQ